MNVISGKANSSSSKEGPSEETAIVRAGYARYVLGLLMIINMFNLLDRQVMNILAEPIKRDLGLSDSELGLVTGIGFALVYSVVGIVVGRLADRRSRPLIIAFSVGIWSVFTGLNALAQSFVQLMLCRIGVAVGEAGCTPAAHALISDTVAPEKRASAIAIYSIGNPLGTLVGLALGGLVAQTYGWRTAFMVVAAPGLLLGALAALTIKDGRKMARGDQLRASPTTSLVEVARRMFGKKTYTLSCLAYGSVLMVTFALSTFTAPHFLRNRSSELADLAHRSSEMLGVTLLPLGFLGLSLGVALGLAGAAGTWLGGILADRLGREGKPRALTVAAVGAVLAPLFLIPAFLAESVGMALILLTIGYTLIALTAAPFFSSIQEVTPSPMRATSAAIMLFVISLVGSLGPLLAGVISDFAAIGGDEGKGAQIALLALSTLSWCACALFIMSNRYLLSDREV